MRVRVVAEVVLGVLYAVGASHQALWTLRHSREFYTDMLNRAWFPPAEILIERVLVPNSVVVTVLVVVFQAALAIAILARGAGVGPALVAGGVFSILGALTGSRAETIGYSALAVVHFMLATAHGPR